MRPSIRHIPRRFDGRPEAMGPDLHAIVAHWLLAIGRAGGNAREHRTREAVAALVDLTGWTEAEAREAMRRVAEDLSPSL